MCDAGASLVFYALEGCQRGLHSKILTTDMPGNSVFPGLCSGNPSF